MSPSFNLRGLLGSLPRVRPSTLQTSSRPLSPGGLATATTTSRALAAAATPRRAFSTTPAARAREPKKQPQGKTKAGPKHMFNAALDKPVRKKRKGQQDKQDPKIGLLMAVLNATYDPPPPLRMARSRHLRHWTIHRAWLLFRRKRREQRERELMRQHQAMYAACEELRLTDGPGGRGYLYRVGMQKYGVWSTRAVPIEYARAQVETPGREPWNHGWKR